MDPLFRSLAVALVPQPRQPQPSAPDRETLQRVYFDVNRVRPYSQFSFLPGDSGAQMTNGPQDRIVVTGQLIQYFGTVDSTAGRAREVAIEVLRAISERMKFGHFVQTGITVIAHVPAPGERPDAREFVKEQLLKGSPSPEELGADFFTGGLKFRRLHEDGTGGAELSIEPLLDDNAYLWVNYNVQTAVPVQELDPVASAIDDAFAFVAGPTMSILEA